MGPAAPRRGAPVARPAAVRTFVWVL